MTGLTQQTDRAGAERLRLFVAIELPEAWRAAFARLQTDLQAALDREPELAGVRVRWVRPEGIHLTLKFLGEVEESRLEKIDWALKSAAPEPPGFTVSLGRIGHFSDRRAPSVIWAGIPTQHPAPFGQEGRRANGHATPAPQGQKDQPVNESELGKLVERIETWLASAGFPRVKRSFTPHLTLARLPEGLAPPLRQRIAKVTSAFSLPAAQPFIVERVSLMRSHLGSGPARYERLAAYPA